MSKKKNGKERGRSEIGFNESSFISQRFRIPTIALDEYEIDPDIIALVPRELCRAHRLIPVSRSGGSLVVAMADPTDGTALAAVKAHTGEDVAPVVTTDAAILDAITKYHGPAR
jgi:type IV pilus assembly protein PilB